MTVVSIDPIWWRGQQVASVQIDMACNDPDNGMFAGSVDAIQLPDLCLELGLSKRRPPKLALSSAGFRLSGRLWPHVGVKSWVGNWCWEGVQMRIPDAVDFLLWLRATRWFSADGGWSELFDWWRGEADLERVRLEYLLMQAAATERAA